MAMTHPRPPSPETLREKAQALRQVISFENVHAAADAMDAAADHLETIGRLVEKAEPHRWALAEIKGKLDALVAEVGARG